MAKNKKPHYEESPRHAAMIELRRSGATTPWDSRPNRQRTRADSRRAAIRASDY